MTHTPMRMLTLALLATACGGSDDPTQRRNMPADSPESGTEDPPESGTEDPPESGTEDPPESGTEDPRATLPLVDGWRFIQDDELSDKQALEATGKDWQAVSLPHTWNAEDAASLDLAGSYERGLGWYRLEFPTPLAGVRHWLEFGAASLVADVWLNGEKVGQHKGGFTQFRFDVTDQLIENGTNVLLVKVDNSVPSEEDDVTAIAPLGGDFNVSGGLYRQVSLISTASAVHFDLGDMGGPGVYASTTSIDGGADVGSSGYGSNASLDGGDAIVSVRARVASDAADPGEHMIRVSLLDADGDVAASAEQSLELRPGSTAEATLELQIQGAHLWQGVSNPYLYRLTAELADASGEPVDRVVQRFGIRTMRFDPDRGFYLNGRRLRLHGVALHQDFLGKGWAVSSEDVDTSLGLVMEMGANAVRLGHYPFSAYALERISELGLVAWAETALGLGTTVKRCSTYDASDAYVANAEEQLQELIHQQYNHAAVAVWAVGNETSARQLGCDEPYDNVTPVIRALHERAKAEDPMRPTAYAEFDENIGSPQPFATAGHTDVLATNRYYYWYDLAVEEFEPLLDVIHQRYPDQPLGISEYGAGAALTHHSDNPLGGPPEVRSADEGEVTYQTEEYASYVHEQNYRVISGTPYLWGSFVWNMFDFGSAHRNEGDVLGVNTKGLVTFDRRTRKDPFYFYKANWSREPVTYITGRRYTERAYAVVDVKVYSNADSVELSVNGEVVGSLGNEQCEQMTCVFEDVPLGHGDNVLSAVGDHRGDLVTDQVVWSLNTDAVNIAAGRLATGYVSTNDTRFGSDHFFSGGAGGSIDPGDVDGGTPHVDDTDDPQLYKFYRTGTFSYQIPLSAGSYDVTLGFLEPDKNADVGDRIFSVQANGRMLLEDFDILELAGKAHTAFTRTFEVEVDGGSLALDFEASEGDALVSNIKITPKRR